MKYYQQKTYNNIFYISIKINDKTIIYNQKVKFITNIIYI